MRTLAIDIETYSSVDLGKAGVYKYTSAPDFEILLFAYAFDDEPTQIIDLACHERLSQELVAALSDTSIVKTAFNAAFERVCLSRHLGIALSPESWRCTAVQAAQLGLPLSLDGVAKVLGLEEQKIEEGKGLIRYFCISCKPSKANGGRKRNLPEHGFGKWRDFREYCKQDVEVERAIRKKLEKFPISDREQALYVLDQKINDRGVLVDKKLVKQAITCDELYGEENFSEAQKLTGLENPNSVAQLKMWLYENGVAVESLAKKVVANLAKEAEGEVERLLNLRLQLSKTSVAKYEAMERAVCPDRRVRGLLQFYGANRTGRWAGRLVQVQNLPQNHLADLALARELVLTGRFSDLALLFESVPHTLSELIRTAFIPKSNHRFIVADFSAIEARVIAWLAGEQWRLDVFQTHGKIYEASASQMFKIPIEQITKGSPLRQKGKIAELALGYGGSVGALTAMGALEMGIAEDELKPLVMAWRAANPAIVKFWWDIDKAAMAAVRGKTTRTVGRIEISCKSGMLFITLPSGRRLSYVKPLIEMNKFCREGITYEGVGTNKRWMRIETYGAKLVENIVQAASRDLLAEAMLSLDKAGYEIVMHCHDEAILEVPFEAGSVKEVCDIMGQAPAWADGLPLRADGYECSFYRKD